ncbi:hypothetical protein VFPBJ_04507 [Purpureocillium lilacinum]|uniref:Uncharacterized protein n=1 Tax=Purpureocillium lilacinum TaxID=33203 RepID=A0A179GX96_PURLI|nr:hypothetical protein VFPBJ_04507 [Purpureocillium lilacinum]
MLGPRLASSTTVPSSDLHSGFRSAVAAILQRGRGSSYLESWQRCGRQDLLVEAGDQRDPSLLPHIPGAAPRPETGGQLLQCRKHDPLPADCMVSSINGSDSNWPGRTCGSAFRSTQMLLSGQVSRWMEALREGRRLGGTRGHSQRHLNTRPRLQVCGLVGSFFGAKASNGRQGRRGGAPASTAPAANLQELMRAGRVRYAPGRSLPGLDDAIKATQSNTGHGTCPPQTQPFPAPWP